MREENVFRTKTGYCRVEDERIVLMREGVNGEMAHVMVGDRIGRILVIYSALALFLAYQSWRSFQGREFALAVIFGSLALLLIYLVIRSRSNSASPVIDRSAIRHVHFRPAVPGVTRALFEVHFANHAGQMRKRLIMLPGSMTNGPEETEKALRIMRRAGLLSDQKP